MCYTIMIITLTPSLILAINIESLFNKNKKDTNIITIKLLKINSEIIKKLNRYDNEEISDDREQLLKERSTLNTEPRTKHLLKRRISIETEHLLNAIYLSLFRVK